MDPNTTSAIRDIFVMLAAGVFAALCLTIAVLLLKLYRPLRDAAHSGAKTAENLTVITGNLATVSEETANNVAQTSRNTVAITENLKESSEDLSGAIKTAREAARSASEAATTAAKVAESVSRLTSLGLTGGTATPVGSLLRFVRSMFGNNRRSDDGGGVQQGA